MEAWRRADVLDAVFFSDVRGFMEDVDEDKVWVDIDGRNGQAGPTMYSNGERQRFWGDADIVPGSNDRQRANHRIDISPCSQSWHPTAQAGPRGAAYPRHNALY